MEVIHHQQIQPCCHFLFLCQKTKFINIQQIAVHIQPPVLRFGQVQIQILIIGIRQPARLQAVHLDTAFRCRTASGQLHRIHFVALEMHRLTMLQDIPGDVFS